MRTREAKWRWPGPFGIGRLAAVLRGHPKSIKLGAAERLTVSISSVRKSELRSFPLAFHLREAAEPSQPKAAVRGSRTV